MRGAADGGNANTLMLLTIAGCGVFALIMVSLHFLRRDVSPLRRGMSRYAGGRTLALTTVGFFALACALLSLADQLRNSPRQGSVLLVAATVGLGVVALTPVGNPSPYPALTALHVIGGLTFYVSMAGTMFLAASDQVDHWFSRIMAVAVSLILLARTAAPGFRPVAGLLQRVVFVIVILWTLRTVMR